MGCHSSLTRIKRHSFPAAGHKYKTSKTLNLTTCLTHKYKVASKYALKFLSTLICTVVIFENDLCFAPAQELGSLFFVSDTIRYYETGYKMIWPNLL